MLNGKTALITGSSLGIGYAVADKLASLGCNLVMNGIEDAAEIGPNADALAETHGVTAVYEACDVGDGAAMDALCGRALDRFGGIDIVVNNAVTRVFGAVEDTDPDHWEHAVDVNLNAAFRTIHHAMPGMKQKGWGRIVNMSSIYGSIGAVNRASYVTTKHALIGLTRAVALEVAKLEITCNAVAPGAVRATNADSAINAIMEADGLDETAATAKFLDGKNPSGRFAAAESVAELVAFLCSDAGRDINGAVLPVDQGWSAA
ncbi:MAG: SDR family oxidoreductase [Rhodospirillales bacterium]|nr:SDR family oxidoreductase [Rhodospirillales bacterium]MBO6786885.1 SDR family oxidoreductase [Rhodospirillales bacterium]